MSQENVETVRRVYEALDKNDYVRVLAEAEPDFEWVPPAQDIAGPVRGFANLRRFLEDQEESFNNFRVEPEELREHGDQVLAFIRVRGEGGASSVPFDIRAATLWTFRGSRLIRGQVFPDRQEALKTFGLSE